MTTKPENPKAESADRTPAPAAPASAQNKSGPAQKEFGGPKGPEPTRYGDWEQKGRCSDF